MAKRGRPKKNPDINQDTSLQKQVVVKIHDYEKTLLEEVKKEKSFSDIINIAIKDFLKRNIDSRIMVRLDDILFDDLKHYLSETGEPLEKVIEEALKVFLILKMREAD